MEKKLFEPSVDKLKYTITIEVYENCSTFSVVSKIKGDKLTYYDVIGALESKKQDLIWQQREVNISKKLKPKSKSTKK